MRATAKLAIVAVLGAGAALAARALRGCVRLAGADPQAPALAGPGPGAPADEPRAPLARNGAGPTRAELYAEAKRREIPGRSSMSKSQLEIALADAGGRS